MGRLVEVHRGRERRVCDRQTVADLLTLAAPTDKAATAAAPQEKITTFSVADDGTMAFMALEGFGESRSLTALRRK